MPVRKWILPLVLVSVLVFVLSLRQLSDPDLGFHLKYGKWIVENLQVPESDRSTYTVTGHPYVDLHWLFQVVLFGVFIFTGYPGISIFVCLLSMLLFLMLLLRQESLKIPVSISGIALLAAFLVIEPRISPRPEMFTFCFLVSILLILDLYTEYHKNMLCLIPGIMLLWCNMHALFILGFIILAIYFFCSLLIKKKPDRLLLTWTLISFAVCLLNPYGIKGFVLPLELLTRFNPNNIYNQHIQEFVPFFAQSQFFLRDYLFMVMLAIAAMLMFFNSRNQKPHEIALLVFFGILAICSVRNIPLFVLIATPVISKQVCEMSAKFPTWQKYLSLPVFYLMIILPLALIPRLCTNAYYLGNNSFHKTGMGLNRSHLPIQAANFLIDKHLKGRILNSIGFGGWLSWTLPQPIFIDGRLEVMQEQIYREVTQSWNGGLTELIEKYHPQLIVYNYLKYYPWTLQLKEMNDWRLIYVDGIAAVFARNEYAVEIPETDQLRLPAYGNPTNYLGFRSWMKGFIQSTDYVPIDKLHLALFRSQIYSPGHSYHHAEKAVQFYNAGNINYGRGEIQRALANYDTAILLQPGYCKAYNNRGILRANALKDYAGALADFSQAIKLNPGFGEAFLGRGTVYFLLRNYQSACKDWESARFLGNVQAARLVELHCNRE